MDWLRAVSNKDSFKCGCWAVSKRLYPEVGMACCPSLSQETEGLGWSKERKREGKMDTTVKRRLVLFHFPLKAQQNKHLMWSIPAWFHCTLTECPSTDLLCEVSRCLFGTQAFCVWHRVLNNLTCSWRECYARWFSKQLLLYDCFLSRLSCAFPTQIIF